MFEMPSSPQSIGKVLDTGFRLFAYSFKRVFVLALLTVLAFSVPGFLFNSMATADPEVLAQSFGARMVLTFLVAYVAGMAFYNALYYRMGGIVYNRDSSMGDAVKVGLKKILPVLLSAIFYMLVVTLGLILLVIPGVILMVSLMLFMPLIICDDEGPISALSVSHKLVWGNWWRTLAVFMVPFFVTMIAYMVIGLIAGVAAGVMVAGGGTPDGTLPESYNVVISLLTIVIGLFIYPFFAAFILAQLNDLKLRKRGVDLEAQLGG